MKDTQVHVQSTKLFLDYDIGETRVLANENPELVARAGELLSIADKSSGKFKWGHRMDNLLEN